MLKSFPKIIIIFFLVIFIFQLACLLFLLTLPNAGQAADIKFTPQVQGLDYTFISSDTSTGNIARYVRAIYKYAIGIVGILAAVVLMIGGVMWIVAGGSATAIGEAKAWIGASLSGLLLALFSYVILATVNPALVNFQLSSIPKPAAPTTQSTLKENDSCTSGQAPYCNYGLECVAGKCVKSAEMQQYSQSGQYKWQQTDDCNKLQPSKNNYGETYCPSPKPLGNNYRCCGIYSSSTEQPPSTTAPPGGCCLGKITPRQYQDIYYCDDGPSTNQYNCSFLTSQGTIQGTFYANKKCVDITTLYGPGKACQ